MEIPIKDVDESKITSYTTKARPAEKSNEILEINVDGKLFKCERPKYFHKKFDLAIYTPGFEKEGDIIYNRKIPFFFDKKGRWWCGEEFSSKGMMKFFLANPQKYVEVFTKKTEDTKKIIKIAEQTLKQIYADDIPTILDNLKKLTYILRTFYSYHFCTYVLFDELVYEFKQFLNKYLPKKLANMYMCEFLQAEITKEAIKVGAVGEKRGARDTTYSDDKPCVFYRPAKLFFESKLDNEVIARLQEQKITKEEMQKFLAFRTITPISIQISEEGQYLESKSFCAMMSIVIEKISKKLINNKIITEKKQTKNYSPEELVEILEKMQEKEQTQNPQEYTPYIKSVQRAIGNMFIGTLKPFDWFQAHPMYAKEYIEHVKKFINKAIELNIPAKELGKCWESVSALRIWHFYTLLDLKTIKMPKEERMKISNFMYDIVMSRMVADQFALKSNIIRRDEEVYKLIKKIKPKKATPNKAKLLGKIFNALYNLGAAIDLDIYLDYGIEMEGPYDVSHIYGPGHILVIRRLIDLQAPELWPERQGNKPENVNIYTIYNKNVSFRTDFISAHGVLEGDTINNMEHFILEVDGKLISDEEELKELLKISEQQSIDQWQKIMAMTSEEHKIKGQESRLLPLKNMCKLLNIDWRPTAAMIEAIKNKPYADNTFWKIPETDEEKEKYFLKLYDPRIDFYPGDSN